MLMCHDSWFIWRDIFLVIKPKWLMYSLILEVLLTNSWSLLCNFSIFYRIGFLTIDCYLQKKKKKNNWLSQSDKDIAS